MRILGILVITVGILVMLFSCGSNRGTPEEELAACEALQFTICHRDDKTLCLDFEEDFENHLAHDDYEGECE